MYQDINILDKKKKLFHNNTIGLAFMLLPFVFINTIILFKDEEAEQSSQRAEPDRRQSRSLPDDELEEDSE